MFKTRYKRLQTIALNTFREAVRQKFFGFLIVLAIAFTVSAHFFRQFDFGGSELQFIADFGWGAIFLFGSILAIVATAQLFFSEIENRTAITLLAKPVSKWEFLLGKFIGILLLLAVFTGLLVGLLFVILYLRESALKVLRPEDFAAGGDVYVFGFFVMGGLQYLKFAILSGITLFICTFSNTNLYSVILGFFVMLVCQLQYIARDFWSNLEMPALRYISFLLGKIFPNFQLFNVADSLIFCGSEHLSMQSISLIIGYGSAYVVFFYALSVWSFRTREI